ncbi:hypothetical protein [Virgibacillus dokdonensis]|nr:hypothetical protein [Virgibacillus dokdonensis]
MIICSVNHIAKMYGGNMVFEDITFEIKEKGVFGLSYGKLLLYI